MLTVSNEKKEFKLGRGHESEVRINDISVSRCHAIIKYRDDGFYVEDNISKFGTIVLLKEKMYLPQDHTLAVQVGRTVVSFTVRSVEIEKAKKEVLRKGIKPLLSKAMSNEKNDVDTKSRRGFSTNHRENNKPLSHQALDQLA